MNPASPEAQSLIVFANDARSLVTEDIDTIAALHGGEPMKYIMTPKRLEIIALLALFASGIAILVLGVYLIIWLG